MECVNTFFQPAWTSANEKKRWLHVVTTNLFYSACGAINGFCDHSLIKANHKTHKITSRTNPISLVKRNIYDNKNIYKILLRTQLFCLIKISALYNNFRGPTQLRTNSYLFFFFFTGSLFFISASGHVLLSDTTGGTGCHAVGMDRPIFWTWSVFKWSDTKTIILIRFSISKWLYILRLETLRMYLGWLDINFFAHHCG